MVADIALKLTRWKAPAEIRLVAAPSPVSDVTGPRSYEGRLSG